MFDLNPQEKSVLAGLLTVCLVGAVVHYALNRDARPLRWVKNAGTKPRIYRPDINTATAQELDRIPGIGLKSAQNIVAYRKERGPFSSLYELRKIKGITKKNFQKIQTFYDSGSSHE